MLTVPTSLEVPAIASIGILRAQLFTATPILRLVATPALLGEDFHRVADCVFLLSHCYANPAFAAAFSCKYFKYKV